MKIGAENLADFSLKPGIKPTVFTISAQCEVYRDYTHLNDFIRLMNTSLTAIGLATPAGVIHNFPVSFALTSAGTF